MNYAVYHLGSDVVSLDPGRDITIPFQYVSRGRGLYPIYQNGKIIVQEAGSYLIYAKYQLNGRGYNDTTVAVELQLWRGDTYAGYSAFDFYTSHNCTRCV